MNKPGFRNGKHWTQTKKGRRKIKELAVKRRIEIEQEGMKSVLVMPRGESVLTLDRLLEVAWGTLPRHLKMRALRTVLLPYPTLPAA